MRLTKSARACALSLAASAMLSGCGGRRGDDGNDVDLNAAAVAAEQAIAHYAAVRALAYRSAARHGRAVTARFRCEGGAALIVRFDTVAATAAPVLDGMSLPRLDRQPVGSGMRYSGSGVALQGKGRDVTLTRSGLPPLACREAA